MVLVYKSRERQVEGIRAYTNLSVRAVPRLLRFILPSLHFDRQNTCFSQQYFASENNEIGLEQ
jgi:hypothetical protein